MRHFPKKNLIYIIGSVFALLYTFIFEGVILSNNNFTFKVIASMNCVIFPCYLWLLITTYRSKRKIGFFFIFIILSILFYYGQFILIYFGQSAKLEADYSSLLCGRLSYENVLKALFMQMQSLLCVHIGYMLFIRDDEFNISFNSADSFEETENAVTIPYGFHTVALILFIVSGIATFITLFYNISLGAYMTVRTEESSIYTFASGSPMFYAGFLSQWFLPSFYMLLLYNAVTKNRKKYIFLLIFICFYIGIYLLTGARFQVIKIFLAVFLIHYYFVEKITWKQLKWLIPVLIIAMFILSSMSQSRHESLSVGSIFSGFTASSFVDQLYNIFLEPGSASVSLANTIEHCPSDVPHIYFVSFLKVIDNILPSFISPFNGVGRTTTSNIFSPIFYGWTGSGYGSSFVTEAYYYWGSFIYIVMLLYGCAFGKIEDSFSGFMTNENIFSSFASVLMMSELIFCVRNDVFQLGRVFVYCILIPCILVEIMNSLYSRRIGNNTRQERYLL